MFKYKSFKAQMIEKRHEIEASAATLQQVTADIDYIAMMSEINLETEENKDE